MPAYSFKERFCPLIISGEKRQTIRSKRKAQAKPGDTVYLYFGMRTKWCKKLGEGTCTGTKDITITKIGTVYIDGRKLLNAEKDALAFNDGFRHADDPDKEEGCFDIMLRWWKQTHELPFNGDIIYWIPSIQKK